MKEETIRKINGIGQAGEIIARIIRVFLIVGFVGIIIGLIATLIVPKNMVHLHVGTDVDVRIDLSGIKTLSEEEQQEVRSGLSEAMREGDEDGTVTGYEVSESEIKVRIGVKDMEFGLRSLIGVMIVGMLYTAASYVTLWFVGLLCRAFRNCHSPFDEEVIRRMRNFAFSLIPWAVLSMISDSIVSRSLFNASRFEIGINLGTALLVLLILGICRIFTYGAELQREHDETL